MCVCFCLCVEMTGECCVERLMIDENGEERMIAFLLLSYIPGREFERAIAPTANVKGLLKFERTIAIYC